MAILRKLNRASAGNWLSLYPISESSPTRRYGNTPVSITAASSHRICLTRWSLTGSAISFGLSIRLLCLSGFLTPARALLRTYADTLFTCLAILDDPKMALAYVEAGEDDKKVKDFWHAQASPKNLHTRIMQIEEASGLDQATINEMKQWRLREFARQSQSTHPSFLSAAFTAWHPTKDETVIPALFGAPPEHSSDIINYASATTWYFSRFSFNKIIGKPGSSSLFAVDYNNARHLELVVSHDILSRIWLSHGGWT